MVRIGLCIFPFSRGTSVQVRVAEVVQRRVQGGRYSDVWLRGCHFQKSEFPSSHHREETSELLRQSFFNLLEARRPNGTGGFSNCCSRQLHRMASDFSSSET